MSATLPLPKDKRHANNSIVLGRHEKRLPWHDNIEYVNEDKANAGQLFFTDGSLQHKYNLNKLWTIPDTEVLLTREQSKLNVSDTGKDWTFSLKIPVKKTIYQKPTLAEPYSFYYDGSTHVPVLQNCDTRLKVQYVTISPETGEIINSCDFRSPGKYAIIVSLQTPAVEAWFDNTTTALIYPWTIVSAYYAAAIPQLVSPIEELRGTAQNCTWNGALDEDFRITGDVFASAPGNYTVKVYPPKGLSFQDLPDQEYVTRTWSIIPSYYTTDVPQLITPVEEMRNTVQTAAWKKPVPSNFRIAGDITAKGIGTYTIKIYPPEGRHFIDAPDQEYVERTWSIERSYYTTDIPQLITPIEEIKGTQQTVAWASPLPEGYIITGPTSATEPGNYLIRISPPTFFVDAPTQEYVERSWTIKPVYYSTEVPQLQESCIYQLYTGNTLSCSWTGDISNYQIEGDTSSNKPGQHTIRVYPPEGYEFKDNVPYVERTWYSVQLTLTFTGAISGTANNLGKNITINTSGGTANSIFDFVKLPTADNDTYTTDFNTLKRGGMYRLQLGSNWDNSVDPSATVYTLIFGKEGKGLTQFQWIYTLSSGYVRTYNSNTNTWTAWRKIAMTTP